jgi:hypothetical protein
MFVKDFFKSFKSTELDNSFYRLYKGEANSYTVKNSERSELIQKAKITIADSKTDPFKYSIGVAGGTINDAFAFPLVPEETPVYSFDPEKQAVVFEFKLQNELTLLLEFVVSGDRYDGASRFRDIIAKLIYQTRYRKAWRECKSEEEYLSLIKDKVPPVKENLSSLLVVFDKILDRYSPSVCAVGKFGQVEYDSSNKPPQIILSEAIFAILPKKQAYSYEIVVFDNQEKIKYSKDLNDSFNYFIDNNNNNIVWLDNASKDLMICYGFYFQKHVINDVNLAISTVMLEIKEKASINQIIEKSKNDYDQFYMQPSDYHMEEEDLRIVEKYQENDYDIDISDIMRPAKKNHPKDTVSNDIRTFVQGKTIGKALASQGQGIGVYRLPEGNKDLEYMADIPMVKSLQGESLHPLKMHLQEADSKLVFLDQNQKDRMFYFDLEKQKMVSEFDRAESNGLRDISILGGKDNNLVSNSIFLGIGEKNIYKVDPRIKNGEAQTKAYKTNPKFDTIVSVYGDNYAIGSSTGEIRFYNSIGGNAKNLIPSYSGSGVVSLDSSKDGSFLLVNIGKDLLLFPTFQGDLSAYSTIFRKNSKPTPKILKVHPSVLSNFGLTETQFITAKFDERKNGKEQFIIATSQNFIAIWNLNRVLQGYLDTKNVKKINDSLIGGEFIYDNDGIIAAMRDKLVLQPNKRI